MQTGDTVKFKLTPEQQEMVKQFTGRKSEFLYFTVQELEERVAPARYPEL